MRSLIAFALVLAACRGSDRSLPPTRGAAAPSTQIQRGSDALVLRAPRRGGVAHVNAYPNVDSTVWSATDATPALDHVLAFDADAGLIAAVDSRGFPVWLDLNLGTVTIPDRGKLRGLSSVDGSTIYGVGPDGTAVRFTPSGNSVYKLPKPARQVFPQVNGTLLVLGGRGDATWLWRTHPPESTVLDSLALPNVSAGTGAPLGDRIYFLSGGKILTGVQARTLRKGSPIKLQHAVTSVASTPSGDRFYVLTDSSHTLQVVDGFQDRISARIDLPGRARDLRIDPFGRYVLVRSAASDSVWIIGIGSRSMLGTIRSPWRSDVPFVAADGAIATIDGADVVFLDALTHKEIRRAAGGAADFWYPFVWGGFRPRDAALDKPVPLPADTDTVKALPPVDTTVAAPPVPTPSPDSAKTGFTVSFAAVLDESKARDVAAKIVVDGQTARVVTNVADGTAVYRVVLGPFATRNEADQVGKASGQSYYVYAGSP